MRAAGSLLGGEGGGGGGLRRAAKAGAGRAWQTFSWIDLRSGLSAPSSACPGGRQGGGVKPGQRRRADGVGGSGEFSCSGERAEQGDEADRGAELEDGADGAADLLLRVGAALRLRALRGELLGEARGGVGKQGLSGGILAD